MNKKNLIKIVIALLMVGICVLAFVLVNYYNKSQVKRAEDGSIHVQVLVIDIDSNTLSDNSYSTDNSSLYDLMDEHYTLKTEDGTYGKVLLGIDNLITDFNTTYIAIYVNGDYANYGISTLQISDGDVFEFKEERVMW
ncbi:MAG: DUF4430 domain-containing protein [Acholeplasmatales bacterium]|nr:DUF4430 domain-containing protein [Acholeplasmatales bacterium]